MRYVERAGLVYMVGEAPVTFGTKAVVPLEHEIADLVPSETSALPIIEPVGGSSSFSFPKVLRSRLDRFFADYNLSPKTDRTLQFQIASGLANPTVTRIVLD